MRKNIEGLMQKRWLKVLIALTIPALFLIIGFLSISDYGITHDEPVHFMRGEAYFHYFMTGKKDYSDLPAFDREKHDDISGIKKSLQERQQSRNIYQNDGFDFSQWMKTDGGHPPLNAILSSLTVEIFYKRLGILGNVDAHHSIIIILGAFCILGVYLFASEAYGRLAGTVAAVSLSLYPFFLVASHNKIKAGPETAFFTLTIWSLWKGLKDRSWKWLLISSLFCGFALGTKFNIVFLPFIILPWFLILLVSRLIRKERVFSPSFLVSLFLYPLLPLVILYACWPWLWSAPLERFLEVIGYYKTVGGAGSQDWDMIVLARAIFRTPFPILLLSILGIGYALTHFWKEKEKTSLLVLFWLVVPIMRGIFPGMTVYGSIHRMAEYIPPLCILAGVGGKIFFLHLRSFLHRRGLIKETVSHYLAVGIIVLLFIPHLFILVSLHPNEDMYFNFFIGGIKGAQEKGMVNPGITIGNLFLQGVKWLNEHAEKGAVCDVDGLTSNIQPKTLRDDIGLGRYFSGLEREGEYLLFQYEDGKINPYTAALFPEAYLKPIYQVKARNVPIFNVYKNDAAHTYPGMVNHAEVDLRPRWFIAPDNTVEIDLGKKVIPCKIEFIFSEKDSSGLVDGFVMYSPDHVNWRRDAWDFRNGLPLSCRKKGRYVYLLNPPQITQFFKVRTYPIDKITCYQKVRDIKVWWLTDFIYLPFASNFSHSADALTSVINIHQSGKYALVSRDQGFSTDFTVGGKELKINPGPRILQNGWVVYNEGIDLPSGNHQAKLSMAHFQSPISIVKVKTSPHFSRKKKRDVGAEFRFGIEELKNWSFRPSDVTYDCFTAEGGMLLLSSYFDGDSDEDEFVQMRREGLEVDLEKWGITKRNTFSNSCSSQS